MLKNKNLFKATYKKSKIKFYCTVTNLETGKAEYIEIKDSKKDIEYLRAGSAMPGVSKIVEVNNKKYLDGGIADSIPIKKAIELGYDKIIVITTRPIEYRKKDTSLKAMQLLYRKYPNFQKTISLRNNNYNKTVEEIIDLERNGRLFVIRPSKSIPIKRIEHNRDMIQSQYDLGVNDYKNIKRELLKYLKK